MSKPVLYEPGAHPRRVFVFAPRVEVNEAGCPTSGAALSSQMWGDLKNSEPAAYPAASSLARSVARMTALTRATRTPPCSSSITPSIVQPPGVVTESFSRAGW